MFMPHNTYAFMLEDKEAPKIINSAQPVFDTMTGEQIPCTISGIELNEPFPGLATYYIRSEYVDENDKFSNRFGYFFTIIIENMG